MVDEGSKKVEKNWIFRAETEQLAQKWEAKMKEEKSKDILRKTSPLLL